MNPLSLMECNVKSPLQWEWDSFISFNTSTTEIPRKLRPTDWEIDAGGGIDSVSLCSSGLAGGGGASGSDLGGGGSGSDLGYAGFSKSPKSTSISSSSTEVKTYKFTSEAGEGLPKDLCSSEEFAKGIGTSPTLEASFGSGEPVLGLKLGKRTYFEDVCAGNSNPKGSTFPASLASSVDPAKRSKAICQSIQIPRCQVEGCNLDLSSAKDYHRKHRVCESHSKCPKVIVGGLERRFCQQCSRFHGLSEFDEKKRSCRRRLSDHNARRRKPQPEAIQLSAGTIYEGKQHMGLVWNRFALADNRTEEKFLWETPHSSKFSQSKGFMLKPAKFEGFDGQLLFDSNRLPNSSATQHGASGFLPSKTKFATSEILGKDIEEFTISSNLGGTQDFHRALSLLSTSTNASWGSCGPKHVSLDHPTNNNLESVVHPVSQPFPLGSSDYWQTEQHVMQPMTSNRDGGNQFQLFRAPYENYFCSDQLN